MAISAAKAPDDTRDAAPAAIRNLTLRIGFVLLSGEADEASHQKLTAGRCHQIVKRHLTLIFKVDNLRRFFRSRANYGEAAIIANNVLTEISRLVMAALVPAIHVFCFPRQQGRGCPRQAWA